MIATLNLNRFIGGRRMAGILIAGGLMAACLILGGSSSGGVLANAAVQILCLAVIALAVVKRGDRHPCGQERFLRVLTLCFVGLFVLHLLPLPFGIWRLLPGHDAVARALELAGVPDRARPFSLAPLDAMQSLLGVLPALAFILIMPRISRLAGDGAAAAVLAIAALSAVMAMLQVAGGRGAQLYFYTLTNHGDGVGFFANANHFSTLMVVAMPLAMGLAWSMRLRGKSFRRSPFALLLLATLPVLGLLGVMASGSLAGMGLFAVALVGSALIPLGSFLKRSHLIPTVLALGLIVIAAGAGLLQFGDGSAANGMARSYMWSITATAAQHFLPWGSGFGSFEQVFHLFEDRAAVTPIFANHAHNDLLELALEGGAPALVLLIVFLGWLTVRSVRLWFGESSRDPLAQAASVAIVLILLHSLVDYPLRTAAMAAIFGLCCALIARPPRNSQKAVVPPEIDLGTRHLSA